MASVVLEVLQPGDRAAYIIEHVSASPAGGLPLPGAVAPEGVYAWDDEGATVQSVEAVLDTVDRDWREVVRVMGRIH